VPFRVSIPIFPGVRYTASTRRRRPGEPSGCAPILVIFALATIVSAAIQYWYISVPMLVVIVSIGLILLSRDHKPRPAPPAPAWRPMSEAPKDGTVIHAQHRAIGLIPVRWAPDWNKWAWVLHDGRNYRSEDDPDDLLGWREIEANPPVRRPANQAPKHLAPARPPTTRQAPKQLPAPPAHVRQQIDAVRAIPVSQPPAPIQRPISAAQVRRPTSQAAVRRSTSTAAVWRPMSEAPKDGRVIVARHRVIGPLLVRWVAAWDTWAWVGVGVLPAVDFLAASFLEWQEIDAARTPS